MADNKKAHFTTPLGEARWAWLTKPHAFMENGRETGAPKFSIDVYFNPEDPAWKEFCAKLKVACGGKKLPFKWETDENDQRTGLVFASYKTGEKFRPNLFDKFNNRIEDGAPLVGNGSKVRVNFSPNEYTGFGGGVNFYLNAVQVVELVPYETRSASSFGFEAEPAPVGAAAGGAPQAQQEDDLPF